MMDFNNIGEVLEEIFGRKVNDKKIRQYSGFEIDGEKIILTKKQGKKTTYFPGAVKDRYDASVKLDSLDDIIRDAGWRGHGVLSMSEENITSTTIDDKKRWVEQERALGHRTEEEASKLMDRLEKINEQQQKNASKIQQKRKKTINVVKGMKKGENIYKEIQETYDETMNLFKKGIGSSGRSVFETIDSGFESVTDDFVREVQSGSIVKPSKPYKAVKKTSGYVNTKNNYTIQDVKDMKKAYYDFETIGDIGTESFMPTQLSILRPGTSPDGKDDVIQSAIFQIGGKQLEYIEESLKAIKKGAAITEAQKRSLLAMTGYTLDNEGKVVAKHISYNSKVNLSKDNKELIRRIEEGIKILSNKDGLVKGLTSYGDMRVYIKDAFDQMKKNGEYAVAHNGDNFDSNVAKILGANLDELKSLDTLSFIKNNFQLGYKNKSGKRLFAYNLGTLADYFGIDRAQLAKTTGLTQHTAEYDIKFNQKILEAAIAELEQITPDDIANEFEVGVGQVAMAQNSSARRSAYSFKTDAAGNRKGKAQGGDMLFQRGHSYQFQGILEQEVNKVLRKFTKYQDIETGDFIYSHMDTDDSHLDEFANIFEGNFRSVENIEEIGAKDAVLSMFKNSTGAYNLESFVNGGVKSTVQQKRFENLQKSQEMLGSGALLEHIYSYLQQKAGDIMGTSQLGSSLMSAIGSSMGIQQSHIYSVSDLKKQLSIENAGMNVGRIKKNISNFIKGHAGAFKGGEDFVQEAINEITNMNITDESIKTGDGSALIHGFSKWLFENLTDEYKATNNRSADLGQFSKFVELANIESGDAFVEIDKIMDEHIKNYRSHFMNKGTEISDLLSHGDGRRTGSSVSLKDRLTGQDTKDRLKRMGVNTSKIGSRLGVYHKTGETDILKFDENSIGGLISAFRNKIQSENADIGSHIALTDDGKSLRVGVFHSSKYKDVFDEKNNPLWDTMQGVIDISLGEDDVLTMNGMDYINYLMPYLDRDGNVQMGTAREFMAKEVLNAIFSTKNLERLRSGEDIQGSLDYFAKRVIQSASSGGTYKNMTNSFYNEAIDAIRAGATPEQKAVRGSAMSLSRLFEDIAIKSGYDLGEGYDRSQNLENLMMYTTAMAFDSDDHNFVEAMELEQNDHLFVNTNKEARAKFKAMIGRLTDAGEFSLEGLKSQSFLSQITNYIGARDITPMSYLNSAQGRNTDQFFNYLGRKRDIEMVSEGVTQRQAGYKAGLLKNYLTTESGSTILGKDDYLQQDIYDQFVMGYTDDYRLAKAFEDEEFAEKIPRAVREALKKASVWEGGAIISQSAADNMNAYRAQSKEVKELSDFEGTDLINKLRNMKIGDRYDAQNTIFDKSTKIAGIDFSVGDILKGIKRTEKGYLVEYDRQEKARVGSKFTGEFGNRNTIAAIVDDQVMEYLTEKLGLRGAHILTQRADLKGTNISEQIGGRINYIINSALMGATDEEGNTNKEKLSELQNKIQTALQNSGLEKDRKERLQKMFNRMYEVDEKTGLLKSIGMHTSQGYKFNKNGVVADLFDDDKDRDYLFSGQFASDLGNTVLGKDFNVDLVSGAMALSNLYEIKDPIGGGDIEDIYATSKYKIGGRERAAIESRLNFAQHAYQNHGVSFEGLRAYMTDWASPKGASYTEADNLRKSYEKAWQDNLSLNKRENKGKSIAEKLGDISEGNVFEILADGDIAGDNQFLLSDIFSSESGDFIKGMSQEDFERVTRGRIIEAIKRQKGEAFDVNNAKVILNLGKYAATLDDGRKIDQLALSLGAFDFGDGERLTYNENDKTMTSLMSNLYNFEANGRNAQSYVDESVKEYLSVLKSAEDKNSKVFENLKTAKVGSSMSGHVQGVNLDYSKEYGDNTVGVNEKSIRAMLSGLSAEALDNLYYGNFMVGLDEEGQKENAHKVNLNDKNAKSELIKAFINQMKAGKSLTGIAHRYPTTDSEALWFSDVILDKSVGDRSMRFGVGMSTGFNADYDGDTGYLALPFTDLSGKSREEIEKIFEEANLVKKMNSDVATMIGDWTRNNEQAKADRLWKEASELKKDGMNDVSLPSGKAIGEQIADKDVENILGILSKHNFGAIGKFSTFATKYRTMAADKGLSTRFKDESGIKDLANSKMVAALFELTEQDAISAKKIGQRLKFADGKVDMNSIVRGLDEYSNLLYSKNFRNAHDKSVAIVNKAQELGLLDKESKGQTMKGRQATQAIAMIQRAVAQRMGYGDDFYNQAVVEEMSKKYGIEGLTAEGQTGSISERTLVDALTAVQNEFGGVKGFVDTLNSTKSKELTGTYDKDKISKEFSKDLGEIYKKSVGTEDIPKVVEGGGPSGGDGHFANVSVESMRVGTIIAENGILDSGGHGEGLGSAQNTKEYTNNLSGGVTQFSRKGDSSVLYNPQKAWDPNDFSSQIEHLKSADSIFEFLGMQKLTLDDIKSSKVETATLDENEHKYRVNGKFADYDVSASQITSLIDITKGNSPSFANEWFAKTLDDLAKDGSVELKFMNEKGEEESKEFTNVEDIYKLTNNTNWLAAAKNYRSTEMGTAMHKLMELTHGQGMSLEDALSSNDMNNHKDRLARLGLSGDINENLTQRYNQLNGLLESLGVADAHLLAEKSHIISYGEGENALRIGGTFDAAYQQLLMDYKNEGTLNSPAHALQLEVLKDMYRSMMESEGIAIKDSDNEIKKKILASFGADKNFDAGILDFGAMSDQAKLHTFNQIKANSAMRNYLGNAQGFNPVMENGVLKYMSGPGFSKNNYNAYQAFQLLLADDMDSEAFSNAMKDRGFELKTLKSTADGTGNELIYSFFDEMTKKQLDISMIRDLSGKVVSGKTKFSETDLSSEYDKLRKEYLGHVSEIDLLDWRIKEEKNKGDNANLVKIESLKAARFDEEQKLSELTSKANSAIFRNLEVSDELQGLKSFQSNESAEANKGRGILNNLRDQYDKLTVAQNLLANKKFAGLDETALEGDRQKIEEIKKAIDEALKSLNDWNNSEMDSVTDNEKLAVMEMANAAKAHNIKETSEFASTLYSPEQVKDAQKSYLDDLDRIAELERELIKLKNKKTYGKEDRERNSQQIAAAESEIAKLRQRSGYDVEKGMLTTTRRGIDGKDLIDENGNIIQDNISLNAVDKIDFEKRISEQQAKNIQKQNDLIRDNQKLGFFGQLKASFGQAIGHLGVASAGYTAIGFLKQQVHKVTQLTIQLDKTMTDLSIVTGKNREEVTSLMKGYNDLGRELGITTAEVAASANEWYRMGYAAEDANELIKNTSMLAKLGMIEMGQATEYMTSALKGYNVAIEDSSKIVDMATALDMKYAVSAGYILEAMSRTATSAKLAGVEMESLQSMIAVVGETSQKDASVVGESFKTAFARYGNVKAGTFVSNSDYSSLADQYAYESSIADANADMENVNDIEKVLGQVGIKIRNGNVWRSYSDILDEVGKNFKHMSDYEKNAITTAMFGTRQRENGLILLENYNKVLEANKIASESAGTAAQKYLKYQEGLEAAMNNCTAAYEKFVLKLQQSGTIKTAINLMASFLQNFETYTAIGGFILAITNLDKVLKMLSKTYQFMERYSLDSIFGGIRKGFTKEGGEFAANTYPKKVNEAWEDFKKDIGVTKETPEKASSTTKSKKPYVAPEAKKTYAYYDGDRGEMVFEESDIDVEQPSSNKKPYVAPEVEKHVSRRERKRQEYADRRWGPLFDQLDEEQTSSNKKTYVKPEVDIKSNKELDDEIVKLIQTETLTEEEEIARKEKLNQLLEEKENQVAALTDIRRDEVREKKSYSKPEVDIEELENEDILKPDQISEDREKLSKEERKQAYLDRVSENERKRQEYADRRWGPLFDEIDKKDKKPYSKPKVVYDEGYYDGDEDIIKFKSEENRPLRSREKKQKNKVKKRTQKGYYDGTEDIVLPKYEGLGEDEIPFPEFKIPEDDLDTSANALDDLTESAKKAANAIDDLTDSSNENEKANDNNTVSEQQETVANETNAISEQQETAANDANTASEQRETVANDEVTASERRETGANDANTASEQRETVANDESAASERRETGANDESAASGTSQIANSKRKVAEAATFMLSNVFSSIGGSQIFGYLGAKHSDEGAALGTAIGTVAGPLITQGIGTIGAAVGTAFGGPAGGVVGKIIGQGLGSIGQMVTGFFLKKNKEDKQKSEQRQAEKVVKNQEKITSLSSLDNQTKFERYDELAKGVNQYGDNISLTDSEYEEFQTLGDELGSQFDNLIIGTDRFGHSLLGVNKDLGGLTKVSKELLEEEKKKLYKEKLNNSGKGDSLFQKSFENYQEKVKNIREEYHMAEIEIWKDAKNKNKGFNFKSRKLSDGTKAIAPLLLYHREYEESAEAEIQSIIQQYQKENKNKIDWYVGRDSIEGLFAPFEGKDFFEMFFDDPDAELKADIPAIMIDTNNGKLSTEKANELCEKIANVVNKYADKIIQDYEEESKKQQLEFTKEFLPAILNTNPIWEQLDDSTQSFVNQVASSIDLAANDIKSADDYKTLIEDKILSPINKLTEEELLKFEQSISAFADKEHLGIELTLSESSDQYSVNADLVKTAYKNTDHDGYFGTIAKQMGYTYSEKKNEWTDENDVTYSYKEYETEDGKKIGKWESSDGDVMDNDIYAEIIGTNKAEDILDEILLKKYGEGHDKKGIVLKEDLTLEEAQWVAKKSDTWLKRKSQNEIIEAAQNEALTSTGTMKSRIQDAVKESSEMTLSDFEDLIESAENVDDIINEFNGNPPDGLEKQLNLLKDRADFLGISLAEAYNQAKALSSIDKFGMTTKSVQSIISESENMMNIAMGANQGSISGELITYLQEHAPELLGYSGAELSAEIMKSLGTSTLIGASLKGTLSNSNAYFDKIYGELGIKTSSAYSGFVGNYITGSDFNDHIKNNRDMLEYQDLFKEALVEVKDENGNVISSYYSPKKIKYISKENDAAKEWLDNHNIVGDGDWKDDKGKTHRYVQAAAYGGTIQQISGRVDSEMKKAIADKIVAISEHNVKQAKRAFKELTKNIRDLNEQLKDLEKQNAINKLNNELERLAINIDGLDKKISLFDWASGFLAEGDFEGKSKALEDNLSALVDKNKDLSAAMAEVESKTPKSAEEAEALKQKYDELSSSYIENQKAIFEVQKQIESLGVTMLSSAIDKSFEALNKQIKITSDYAKVSNLSTYTGGAAGLLNYNLAGTLESKSEIDKKRNQYETLLKMQEDFNDKSLELNRQYLNMKEKQDAKDYSKQKSDTAESIRDARVEFFQEYGHILQERLGDKDKALAAVGLTEQDFVNYYSSKLNIKAKGLSEAMIDADNLFGDEEPIEEPSGNDPKGGDKPKGDEEPKAKTPTIEGTDAKVDTPESVSNHITETMKAGIDAANAEMIENSKDYGVKATPFDSESWGVDLESGLGLDIKKAYQTIIKNLNKYIETTNTEGTKLISPKLDWDGPRGWGVDNPSSDSLISRMKKRIKLCVEALNTYISTDSGVGKLSAPKIDQETWEIFGITIGKYISNGINSAVENGIEKELDDLIDSYKEKKQSGDRSGVGSNTSGSGSLSSVSYAKKNMGIPAGYLVDISSNSKNGHVGIMGDDGRIYHQFGSTIRADYPDNLPQGRRVKGYYSHGYPKLSEDQIQNLMSVLVSAKNTNDNFGLDKNHCLAWTRKVYEQIGISSSKRAPSASEAAFMSANSGNYFSYSSGTEFHQGGLALVGDEGLIKNKTGIFSELAIYPNGEIGMVGTHGPEILDLPRGTQILSHSDTEKALMKNGGEIYSYASGTPTANADYQKEINAAADAYGIPRSILYSLIDQESSGGLAKNTWSYNSVGAYGITQLTADAIDDIKQNNKYSKEVLQILKDNGVDIDKARGGGPSAYKDNIWTGAASLALNNRRYFNGSSSKRGTDPTWAKSLGWYYAGGGWNNPNTGKLYASQVLNRANTEPFQNIDLQQNFKTISQDLPQTTSSNTVIKDEDKIEQYSMQFEKLLDQILGTNENTRRILKETYENNNYKIPVLSNYEKLENQATDQTTRASYKLVRDLYSRDDEISNYKRLANDAAKKYNEALHNMGLAIEQGADIEIIQAWSTIVDKTKEQMIQYEQAIQDSLKTTMQSFQNFANKVNDVYNDIKENLELDYKNGLLGEKTDSNYYDPLRDASEKQVRDLEKAYNGAFESAINAFLELGYSAEVAHSKAMEEESVVELRKSVKNAINNRKQIEIEYNNDIIANYERSNKQIEERLGYNNNLSNVQFAKVYLNTLENTKKMIEEDRRFLENTDNLSPEDQKEAIDRMNANTKQMITTTDSYINNVLNNSKKKVEASINNREKQFAVGGIKNRESIFNKNINDFKKEASSIAQAIANKRFNLEKEAIHNGLTRKGDIRRYIENHSDMIALNEQYLDVLKKQADEHKNIRDYILDELNNERKLLDLAKENEWASTANIRDYYNDVNEILDSQIKAQKNYLQSKNLSEEEYEKTKMSIAELQREKYNNELQKMQDTQKFYEKEYGAMTYMVNEYISALEDEKEAISKTYDEEITKLQQVNDTKERSIKLTELQNNLEKASNEKKRVYRAGVGFVYEQDRDAIKKAKDELDSFYKQDQIDNLNKAKEMESKILDERIEKWNKYLEAMEKVFKTAERNHNINILENLLGVEGWKGIFTELNSDMSDFTKNYDEGMKIYHGEWTSFLENYETLSNKIYNKLEASVGLLQDIKKFKPSDTNIENKDVSVTDYDSTYKTDDIKKSEDKKNIKNWKDYNEYVDDFSSLYSEDGTASSLVQELKDKYGIEITQLEADTLHEQKQNELLQFMREHSYADILDLISGKVKNTTAFTVSDLKWGYSYHIDNKLKLDEITQKEETQLLDMLKVVEGNFDISDTTKEFILNHGAYLDSLLKMSEDELKEGYGVSKKELQIIKTTRDKMIQEAYATSKVVSEFEKKLVGILNEEDMANAIKFFNDERELFISQYGSNYEAGLQGLNKGERLSGVEQDIVRDFKKDKVIGMLLNDNIDILSLISDAPDNSKVNFKGVEFDKEELVKIRIKKIWDQFRDGFYSIYDTNGTYNHYESLKAMISAIEPSLKETENIEMEGMFGDFVDTVEDYIHQSKSEIDTTIEDVSIYADKLLDLDKILNDPALFAAKYPDFDNTSTAPQGISNYWVLNNLILNKEDKIGTALPDAMRAQSSILNHT